MFTFSPDFFNQWADEELEVDGQEPDPQVEEPAVEGPMPRARVRRRQPDVQSQNPSKRRGVEAVGNVDAGKIILFIYSFFFTFSYFFFSFVLQLSRYQYL